MWFYKFFLCFLCFSFVWTIKIKRWLLLLSFLIKKEKIAIMRKSSCLCDHRFQITVLNLFENHVTDNSVSTTLCKRILEKEKSFQENYIQKQPNRLECKTSSSLWLGITNEQITNALNLVQSLEAPTLYLTPKTVTNAH